MLLATAVDAIAYPDFGPNTGYQWNGEFGFVLQVRFWGFSIRKMQRFASLFFR